MNGHWCVSTTADVLGRHKCHHDEAPLERRREQVPEEDPQRKGDDGEGHESGDRASGHGAERTWRVYPTVLRSVGLLWRGQSYATASVLSPTEAITTRVRREAGTRR